MDQETQEHQKCRGCGARIAWQRTIHGGWTPTNLDGTPHWMTCPAAEEFRKKKKRDEAQQGFEW
jgi:hypothetical protein